MRRLRLFWQIYPAYLLVILSVLLLLRWYASGALHRFYHDEQVRDLEARARLLAHQLPAFDPATEGAAVDSLCKVLGRDTATRLTVVLASGRVVGDSDSEPAVMDNHATRPEIAEALRGRTGTATRYSHTLQEEMLYLAVPLQIRGEVVAAVRAAISTTAIDRTLNAIGRRIAIGGIAVAVLAAVISLLVARGLTRPIERLRDAAGRYARGELDHRLPSAKSEEMETLVDAMNRMASELSARLRELESRHNEQAALLSGMMEGVIAVDSQERLISLNPAAARLLGVNAERVKGRSMEESVRNVGLHRFVRRVLSERVTLQDEIVLRGDEERFLQARGAVLSGPGDIGAIVVLSDVTTLRRLERVRQEFVANVSHELRTPITSIKGFVETLRDGALRSPRDAERFLDIIQKQVDRLSAIVEDLLSLSKIEQKAERAEITLEARDVNAVLRAAVRLCESRALEKGIELVLTCEDGLRAAVNEALLEEAVENLIDNAIKYSEPGGRVQVEGLRTGESILIRVRDFGCGIAREHLPRIFERFYTVDRARSRKLGGTGLGLSIVKHIAGAHGGKVTVESEPQKGSTFTIWLPAI